MLRHLSMNPSYFIMPIIPQHQNNYHSIKFLTQELQNHVNQSFPNLYAWWKYVMKMCFLTCMFSDIVDSCNALLREDDDPENVVGCCYFVGSLYHTIDTASHCEQM